MTAKRKAYLRLWCNSAKCTTGKPDSRFSHQANAAEILEGTEQDHEYVSSDLDKANGWKVGGIRSQGGCRDSAADYRTVRCMNCGAVNTYDFARD